MGAAIEDAAAQMLNHRTVSYGAKPVVYKACPLDGKPVLEGGIENGGICC